MKPALRLLPLFFLVVATAAVADTDIPDAGVDILVTFSNEGASISGSSVRAPYRARRRYSIAASTRRDADAIAATYALVEIDHWPIRSLEIYCFVYRVPAGRDRVEVIAQLRADARVDSAQPLQEFETCTSNVVEYNDTYVNLQHGLGVLDIAAAHRYALGRGIRVALVDRQADADHEDLKGRIHPVRNFTPKSSIPDNEHGTAVASVIGANANNALGIVGIAPQARLELFVSCWAMPGRDSAVCDSFTLAKALDTMLEDPPDVLNLSLTGPDDPLVKRLIDRLVQNGVIVIAAYTASSPGGHNFPARLDRVIGVGNSQQHDAQNAHTTGTVYAPGEHIMVAVPDDAYDFRSGSSLAAAHVSGIVALLLSVSPDLSTEAIAEILLQSQATRGSTLVSVDACRVLHIANGPKICGAAMTGADLSLELKTGTQGNP